MAETPNPAVGYLEYLVPALFEPLAREVFAISPPRRGERVLDVACGTGIVARKAAELVGRDGEVVGVDVNPRMIEVAKELPPPAGAPTKFMQGDGTALDLSDDSFDVVYCQQGLQFFPDRSAGVQEMRRVLVDGGRAVIAAWLGIEHQPLFAALADAEERHLAAAGVPASRDELEAPFSLGDSGEIRTLFEQAGFGDVHVTERAFNAEFATADRFIERMEFAYAAVVPAFVENAEAFNGFVENVARDTRDVVERYTSGDRVVAPMKTNIVVATC
jgi:ubiquinone/menaquinone biosynthesis C-methylase UbiE